MHKNSPATAIQSLSGFQKKSDVTIRSTDSDNDTVPDQVRLTRAQYTEIIIRSLEYMNVCTYVCMYVQ